jgi:hypothetical protein
MGRLYKMVYKDEVASLYQPHEFDLSFSSASPLILSKEKSPLLYSSPSLSLLYINYSVDPMHRRVPSLHHGLPHAGAGMPHAMGNLHLGPTPNMSWLADSLHPRKFRIRATLLCLFSLMTLTTYICLISPPALSFERRHHLPPHWRHLAAQFPLPPPGPPPRPDVLLSPEQELGALTAFMAALPQNVIPSNIDPSRPIDPQLVLDFDTRGPEAEDEIDDVVLGVWMNNPVVLFTKVRDKRSSAP